MYRSRSKIVEAAILAGFLLVSVDPASAKEVPIAGLHSLAAVKAACERIGGDFNQNGSSYGCENPARRISVYCDRDSQRCRGYVPRMIGSGKRGSVPYASPAQILGA